MTGGTIRLAPALNVQQPDALAVGVLAQGFAGVGLRAGLERARFGWPGRALPDRERALPGDHHRRDADRPNPNLKPEDALSSELAITRAFEGGSVRVSGFTEDIKDALISQIGAAGHRLDHAVQLRPERRQGGEPWRGTGRRQGRRADPRPLAVRQHHVSWTRKRRRTAPSRRRSASRRRRCRTGARLWWRPTGRMINWAFTLAGRYIDRIYATIDNSDTVEPHLPGLRGLHDLGRAGDLRRSTSTGRSRSASRTSPTPTTSCSIRSRSEQPPLSSTTNSSQPAPIPAEIASPAARVDFSRDGNSEVSYLTTQSFLYRGRRCGGLAVEAPCYGADYRLSIRQGVRTPHNSTTGFWRETRTHEPRVLDAGL